MNRDKILGTVVLDHAVVIAKQRMVAHLIVRSCTQMKLFEQHVIMSREQYLNPHTLQGEQYLDQHAHLHRVEVGFRFIPEQHRAIQ